MKYANDNSELSFLHIAAVTANVVRYLKPDEDKNVERSRDGAPNSGSKRRPEEEREYIEKRLAELAAFERRISGRKD